MPWSSKMVTSIDSEISEDLVDGKLLIAPSKQEEALKMAASDKTVADICGLAADDPLIRLLVFLRHDKTLVPNRDYPLEINCPVFVTMDEKWLERSIADTGKRILEELTKKRDEAQTSIKDSGFSIIYRIMKTLYEDRVLRDTFLKNRIPRGGEADSFFDRLLEKHKPQTEELVAETTDLYSANEAVMQRFEPVIRALEKADDAKVNHQILMRGGMGTDGASLFGDSLGKIEAARGIRISIRSVCLECLVRFNLDPYLFIQLYSGTPEIIPKCQKCAGKTIFTNVGLNVPASAAHLFFEGYILDFVVAHVLCQSKMVRRVYVHKSVRLGQGSRSREIDVLLITDDNKAIAVDVNGSSVRGEVLLRANELRHLCDDVPISKLICIDADPVLEEYSNYGRNTVIMHAKHIADLTAFMEGIIRGREFARRDESSVGKRKM